MTTITLYLLGIILTVIITYLVQEILNRILVKILGGFFPRRKRDVKGLWYSTYNFDSSKSRVQKDIIEIKRFGKHIIGNQLTNDKQVLKGKLQYEIYFTGTWENISRGDIYHGSFQFVLDPDGKSMKGRWLGFKKNQEVQSGEWILQLLSPDISKMTRKKWLEEHKTQGIHV